MRFRTKKHLALLVYLAVDARSHRRERLAEFLWPCASLIEARHSLATALSILRPRVGRDALETSRDHVRLLPGRIALDLQRLQTGDILGTEITGPLEVAAFLDNFDVPDSTEFTHWKDGQQARLLPLIKDALVVLIDRCRRTGDSRQIEQLADRMLALDDLSEQAIRAKMEARAFAGDRLTALQIFESWKAKLADDLQALPSDLVEGMAVRLRRRGWERTTLTHIPNVPTDQWRGRRFIGRSAEYRVLYEAWEGIRTGAPGHVLVLGDSGVGKSTLVERLTTAAGLEGAAVTRVQCYDLEREIPYSTISGLVLGLLDRPGVSATPSESLAELARTVPEVRHRFPAIPPAGDSQGESARIRLTEAFHDMVVAVAEEHPVILVVDDLHLADDVSLAVLHLMMRRARGQPIMVLLVARPGELPQSPQAEKLRTAGAALGIKEMELQPLTEHESLELLQSLIPDDQPRPGQAVQRALLRGAAGYPMVLELLVQDWEASGEQSLALSVDAMTTDPGSGGPAAGVYRKILDRITRSLNPTTHNVLNLASLLGQRLNDPSMYGLVDLSVG
ncbi:MAG TPA: AAA family ATPase, partial [Gemmatimonadales bacterium]